MFDKKRAKRTEQLRETENIYKERNYVQIERDRDRRRDRDRERERKKDREKDRDKEMQ